MDICLNPYQLKNPLCSPSLSDDDNDDCLMMMMVVMMIMIMFNDDDNDSLITSGITMNVNEERVVKKRL